MRHLTTQSAGIFAIEGILSRKTSEFHFWFLPCLSANIIKPPIVPSENNINIYITTVHDKPSAHSIDANTTSKHEPKGKANPSCGCQTLQNPSNEPSHSCFQAVIASRKLHRCNEFGGLNSEYIHKEFMSHTLPSLKNENVCSPLLPHLQTRKHY